DDDDDGTDYDDDDYASDDAEDRALWRSLAEGTRGTIVEFGCGAGRILEALNVRHRSLIGLDRDPEAIAFARERVPTAQILDVDLFHWVPPKSLERSAGLVIAGGDLLPLLLLDEELRRVMDLAAHLVAPDGL
ncbi:MAG: class I SAM-dependent methyltransferase, partial [Candidatus Limnocylindrus sp.]